ncbi:hypothetical protein GQ53DRAFT_754983 [Thozetella sp. PMI_491]|nr:hypothetical protein GQ53DRAFT_754983 [Thozetella sp. PMI_491]
MPGPMHLSQLRTPLQRVAAGAYRSTATYPLAGLAERFACLRLDGARVIVEGRRYASVKSQGAYRIPNKKTKPKKLGAKRTGDQYVIPGNIIYKQRGTIWHPGENALMGRDHTIHAAAAGFVKYYRDPMKHPKRQYIGVVFNRNDTLPYPPGNPRKRKLGLVAVPRKVPVPEPELITASGIPRYVVRHEDAADREAKEAAAAEAAKKADLRADGKKKSTLDIMPHVARELEEIKAKQGTRILRLQKDYSYRETNWEIGRLVGPVGHVQGTEKLVSRKSKLRLWRRKRFIYFARQKAVAKEKKGRRVQLKEEEKKRSAIKAQELAQLAAEEKARVAAQVAADAAKVNAANQKPKEL